MDSSETQVTARNVYDTCDPHFLRQLREQSGMDHSVLARTACLSVAQVRYLETENATETLFYTDAIKRQAYKRLLMILGAEPPTVEVVADAQESASRHPTSTLDQIVAMSEQPSMSRPIEQTLQAQISKIWMNKQAAAAFVLLVVAIVLYVYEGPLVPKVSETLTEAAPVHVTQPVTEVKPALAHKAVESELPAVAAAMAVSSAPVVQTMPVAQTQPLVSATAAPMANKALTCGYTSDTLPTTSALNAQKAGTYIYFVSEGAVDLCVVDGKKQATVLSLKPGDKRSVYGAAPWQLSGSDLSKVQMYFQGWRVILPDNGSKRMALIEKPVTP